MDSKQNNNVLTKKIMILTVLIGFVSGFVATFFYVMLQVFTELFLGLAGFRPEAATGEPVLIEFSLGLPYTRWVILIVPVIGGLLSGFLVYQYAPEAEGHGTDAIIEAFHYKRGKIRGRVPPIKTLASAITIGSGGSAGREGPIAQISGGVASFLADKLHLTDREREIMVMTATASGIGCIFKAPLGGAIFGTEVLYKRDYEVDIFIPAIIASFIAYSIFALFTGWQHIFVTPVYRLTHVELPLHALLGLLAGGLSKVYVRVFYAVRDSFKKLPIRNHYKPMIGGIAVGIIGYFYPQTLSTGYGVIQGTMYLRYALELMVIILLLKIITTSMTIGSGGSGGVFAPSITIGAMLGGVFGIISDAIFPDIVVDPAVFVLIGMASFFSGAAKVPLAAVVMVTEMTGDYNILVPAALASSIAYLVSGEDTIYEKQVDTKVHSPVHASEFFLTLLKSLKVRDAMTPNFIVLEKQTLISEIREQIRDVRRHGYRVLIVKSTEEGYIGLIPLTAIYAIPKELWQKRKLSDLPMLPFTFVKPTDSLLLVISLMWRYSVSQLPVYDPTQKQIIGEINYRSIFKALHEKTGVRIIV